MSVTPFAVIVLAAGGGTRMKSETPKVLHRAAGRTLVGHVLAAARDLHPEHLVVVVGHGREQVITHLAESAPDVRITVQHEQKGTGHAVRECLEQLAAAGVRPGPDAGPILVLTGDTPLLTGATLQHLVQRYSAADGSAPTAADEARTGGSAVTVLTAVLTDPSGYGRIVRSEGGDVTAIVEHKDADPATLQIHETNSGMYAFDPHYLGECLRRLTTDNAQGEEYLTDVVGLAVSDGRRVTGEAVPDPDEILGVNDRSQLATAARILRQRTNLAWMRAGVTMIDPETTYIDVDVDIAADVTLEPNVHLRGATSIAAGAVVGPDTTLVDCEVGPGAQIRRSEATLSVIGAGAVVGPFSFLRPNARLAEGSKAGAFVEVKNSVIGAGSKVPHLSYVGDATIGERSNIGAATVFVNYDGITKSRTEVGNDVRVGSDSMLVAPLTIGDGAYTAAGSVITEDVPPGALAVARGRQRNVEGWVLRNREGTSSAAAAAAAEAAADAGALGAGTDAEAAGSGR